MKSLLYSLLLTLLFLIVTYSRIIQRSVGRLAECLSDYIKSIVEYFICNGYRVKMSSLLISILSDLLNEV